MYKYWHICKLLSLQNPLRVVTFRCRAVSKVLSANDKVCRRFSTVKTNCEILHSDTGAIVAVNLCNEPPFCYNVRTSAVLVPKRMADTCDKTHSQYTPSGASIWDLSPLFHFYSPHTKTASATLQLPSALVSNTPRICIFLKLCTLW